VKSVRSPCGFGPSWMMPNWIFLSMPLVIGSLDGLGLDGVPYIDTGLVGVTSGFLYLFPEKKELW